MPLSSDNLKIWCGCFFVPALAVGLSLFSLQTIPEAPPKLPKTAEAVMLFVTLTCWTGSFYYQTTTALTLACAASFATPWICYLFLPDDKTPSNPGTTRNTNTDEPQQAPAQVATWSTKSLIKWASDIAILSGVLALFFSNTNSLLQEKERQKREQEEKKKKQEGQDPRAPDGSQGGVQLF